MDLSVVDTMLHDSPDLVFHRTEIWAVLRPHVERKKVWRFSTQQFNSCTCAARCAGGLSCWNRKSLPDTLRIAGCSIWRHYDVTSWSSIEEVNKRYHHNFLLCRPTNNEITACIADFFNSFCEEVYAVAFFKVVLKGFRSGLLGSHVWCVNSIKNEYEYHISRRPDNQLVEHRLHATVLSSPHHF